MHACAPGCAYVCTCVCRHFVDISVYMSAHVSVHLSVHMSVHIPAHTCVHMLVRLIQRHAARAESEACTQESEAKANSHATHGYSAEHNLLEALRFFGSFGQAQNSTCIMALRLSHVPTMLSCSIKCHPLHFFPVFFSSSFLFLFPFSFATVAAAVHQHAFILLTPFFMDAMRPLLPLPVATYALFRGQPTTGRWRASAIHATISLPAACTDGVCVSLPPSHWLTHVEEEVPASFAATGCATPSLFMMRRHS